MLLLLAKRTTKSASDGAFEKIVVIFHRGLVEAADRQVLAQRLPPLVKRHRRLLRKEVFEKGQSFQRISNPNETECACTQLPVGLLSCYYLLVT